jgi:hypothetical protein
MADTQCAHPQRFFRSEPDGLPFLFHSCPLRPDLRLVPGLDSRGIMMLSLHEIRTADQLVGVFFMCDRNQEQFLNKLVTYGIPRTQAGKCTLAVSRKFGSV